MLWFSIALASACPSDVLDQWIGRILSCGRCMEAEIDAVLREQPACTEASLARAALHHQVGEDDAALAVLQAADPEDARVAVALAVAAHHAGVPDEGALQRARRLDPRDPLLIRLEARALPASERADRLLEAHATVVDRDLTLELLEALVAAGRPGRALEIGRLAQTGRADPLLDAAVAELVAQVPVGVDDAFVHIADDDLEEIVVYSVAAARRRLEARLKELGYGEGRSKPGGTRYTPERPMMPWVQLNDDGTFAVQKSGPITRRAADGLLGLGRSGPALTVPDTTRLPNTPLEQQPSQVPMVSVRVDNLVSRRKLSNARDRVLRDIQPQLLAWRRALAEERFTQSVEARVPRALRALWEEGHALDHGPAQVSHAERRRALLTFWQTRSCAAEGERVRQLVEDFVLRVVQESPHRATEAELSVQACGVRLTDRL